MSIRRTIPFAHDAFRTYLRQFLTKKEDSPIGDLLTRESLDEGALPETNALDQLFHCHSSDLAVGRLSAKNFLYPVLYQSCQPFFHCQAEYVGSPGS